MTKNDIIKFIKANPSCTAKEVGVTNADLRAIEATGEIEAVGNRSTGKRGKPPVEWAITGTVTPEEKVAKETAPKVRAVPTLPTVTAKLSVEEEHQIAYIDREVLEGIHGVREDADVRSLLETRTQIVSRAERRARPMPVIIEEDEVVAA